MSRIMIVDDNPQNIQVLCQYLKEADYEFEYALNGKDALDLITKGDFDLLLLDIQMPGMDGYTLCREVKKIEKMKEVPVIFISCLDDMASIERGFISGGVDYITKPFNISELNVRLNTHLALSENRKALQKEKELNDYELLLAKKIQDSFINKAPKIPPLYDFGTVYHPKRAIGGDFFDFNILGPDRFTFIMADVSGHGIPAALITAMIKVYWESYKGITEYGRFDDCSMMLKMMNQSLSEIIENNFVTALIGEFYKGHFKFSNAGHCLPVLYRPAEDNLEVLECHGTVMGTFGGLDYETAEADLDPGDMLFFYTDGLVELNSAGDEELRERIFLQNVRELKGFSMQEMVNCIEQNTINVTGSFDDDVSLLGFRWKGEENEI